MCLCLCLCLWLCVGTATTDIDVVMALDVATGWQRCIGCLELQVNFRQKELTYSNNLIQTLSRALLRKMTSKDKASFGSSPLCIPVNDVWLCIKMNQIICHMDVCVYEYVYTCVFGERACFSVDGVWLCIKMNRIICVFMSVFVCVCVCVLCDWCVAVHQYESDQMPYVCEYMYIYVRV